MKEIPKTDDSKAMLILESKIKEHGFSNVTRSLKISAESLNRMRMYNDPNPTMQIINRIFENSKSEIKHRDWILAYNPGSDNWLPMPKVAMRYTNQHKLESYIRVKKTSYHKFAQAIGTSMSTIKWILHRGRLPKIQMAYKIYIQSEGWVRIENWPTHPNTEKLAW